MVLMSVCSLLLTKMAKWIGTDLILRTDFHHRPIYLYTYHKTLENACIDAESTFDVQSSFVNQLPDQLKIELN